MFTNMKRISLMVLLLSQAAFAQSGSPKQLMAQLDNYESRYRSAGATTEILSRQADSLAKVIRKRKSNNSRNILSDRALAEELRLSQELADRISDFDERRSSHCVSTRGPTGCSAPELPKKPPPGARGRRFSRIASHAVPRLL